MVRDLGLRSPLPAAARRAGRRSWRRGAGHAPDRRPAAGRRPDPCRARWPTHRRTSAAPLRSPSWPPAVTCMVNSDPLHGAIQFRLHRIALALLERGVDPAELTPLLEPEDLYGAREKLHRLVTRTTSRLRATVHRWPSPSGPAGKAWPGENVDEPSSPASHRPINSNFLLKIIGHVPVLLGHFD